jgi:hypothetical protein
MHSSITLRFAYLALVLPWLAACTSKQADEPGAATTITGRVLMSPQEFVGPTGRTLSLSFRDEGQYSCSNFRLITDFAQREKQLAFTFSGVDKSGDICLTSIGPASSSVDITLLAPGTYPLAFTVGNRQATGQLELTSSYLRVQSDNPGLVTASSSEIRFTPPTAIWGHVIYSQAADQAAAQAVGDSLQRLGATPLTLPVGNYARFAIAPNSLPVPPTVLPGAVALPLLFTYSGNFARVQALITRAKATTPSLNMYLTSYKGEAVSK